MPSKGRTQGKFSVGERVLVLPPALQAWAAGVVVQMPEGGAKGVMGSVTCVKIDSKGRYFLPTECLRKLPTKAVGRPGE